MDKKTLALWGMMVASPFLVEAKTNENPAKLDKNTEVVSKGNEEGEEGMEKVFSLKNFFTEEVEQAVDSLGVSAEFEPSDLDDLRDIQKSIKAVIKKTKELTASDFEMKKGVNKYPTSYAEDLANEIEAIGKQLDDFRERDLDFNKSNTNFSREIGNYLANIEKKLRVAIAFSVSAKRALYAHKDLAGLVENEVTSVQDAGKTLVDPIFYDPEFKDNPFEDDMRGTEITLPKSFEKTKKAYFELKKEISIYRSLSNLLKAEGGKKLDNQDKSKINILGIKIKTSKNILKNLKIEIKKEAIPQDMVTEIYNPLLEELKEMNKKVSKSFDKYTKQRKEVQKYVEEEYLSPDEVDKKILSSELTGSPYNLASAKNLDQIIQILKKYVSENGVDDKYKTDDLKKGFRKKNLFNVLGGLLGGSDDFLLSKGKVEQFEKIDEALAVLSSSNLKNINKIIKGFVKSEVISREINGNEVNEDEKNEIREDISKDILADINKYVMYHNAAEMLKEINDMLDIDKDFVSENNNNKFFQAKRFTKLSLNESLKKYFNYEQKQSDIDTEIYKNQPELFKESFEEYSKYLIVKHKLAASVARLEKIKNILLQANGNEYNFAKDSDYLKKEKIKDNFVQGVADKGKEVNRISDEIKASRETVRSIYEEIADTAFEEETRNLSKSREIKAKLNQKKAILKGKENALNAAQELEAEMIRENNRETVLGNRSQTDEELKDDDTLLLKLQRAILKIENKIKDLDKKLNRKRRDRKELAKIDKIALKNEK